MSEITEAMREAEPFRWCVYCDADWEAEPHTEDCPSNTGVYTILPQDLGHECVHCKERTPGMSCYKCGHVFVVGDTYMHEVIDEGDPDVGGMAGASVSIIVCYGCKAHMELTE